MSRNQLKEKVLLPFGPVEELVFFAVLMRKQYQRRRTAERL
jgi:hypothetical protein